jgi:hypothetical protein
MQETLGQHQVLVVVVAVELTNGETVVWVLTMGDMVALVGQDRF